MFKQFRADPIGWKPGIKSRAGRTKGGLRHREHQEPVEGTAKQNSKSRQNATKERVEGGIKTMSYPFPLRKDITISISGIPRDLRQSEVNRLSAFLSALTSDFDGPSQ